LGEQEKNAIDDSLPEMPNVLGTAALLTFDLCKSR
jgi:hypothetical protein